MTNPAQVPDQQALEDRLAAGEFLLFKHSLYCPVSARAFEEYQRFVADHPDLPTAWLDVTGQRPLSRLVEERSGVRHESPQAILFREGRPVWDASHGEITAESLAGALA
jgi:bacillithiol system protein YtxJ